MEEFIKKITAEAGKKLIDRFKKEKNLFSVREDSKAVVTKHDKEIDIFLIKEIEKKYPKHSILTEESGMKDQGSDYLWIIDSLDGSGNFANGNPLFSVCIALFYKGENILSTTYAPVIEEFYFAKKDKGAFLNNKRIRVSDVKRLKKSYVAFCDGFEKDREKLSKDLGNVFQKVTDLRKIGSAGVETGWLASGRLDGFVMFEGDPWDMASGVLIVEEAGGKVTDFDGRFWQNKRGSFIFSNNHIHSQLKKILS